MLYFVQSPVHTMGRESEDDVVFFGSRSMISIRENPNFCFDKLDFLAEKKEDRPVDIFGDSTSNTLSLGRVRRH